jgi:Protein of unknown function (DUF2530)
MADAPRRPDPPPLETNEFAPVIVATVLWAIAFVVLLSQHSTLAAHGRGWWVWVGLSGVLLGFWGLSLMLIRRRGLRRAQSRSASASNSGADDGARNNSVPR